MSRQPVPTQRFVVILDDRPTTLFQALVAAAGVITNKDVANEPFHPETDRLEIDLAPPRLRVKLRRKRPE